MRTEVSGAEGTTLVVVGVVVTAIVLTPVFGPWGWLGVIVGLYVGKKCLDLLG